MQLEMTTRMRIARPSDPKIARTTNPAIASCLSDVLESESESEEKNMATIHLNQF